jgi:hypothetical protein
LFVYVHGEPYVLSQIQTLTALEIDFRFLPYLSNIY